MFGSRRLSLGIDIGFHSIKVVEVENGVKGPIIRSAALSETLADSSPESVNKALSDLLERKDFRAKRTATTIQVSYEGSATARRIFIENLTADVKNEELKERVQWEAITRDYIPFPAEEAHIDCHIIGEATQENVSGLWVFFIAVRKNILKERAQLLKSLGLIPTVIEIDITASLGFLDYMGMFPAEEDIVLLDIGASKTSICVINRRQLAFYREIPVAGNHITSQIERRLRIKREEAESFKFTEDLFEKISDSMGDIWRAVSPIESVIEERQGLYPLILECFRYYEGDVANAKLTKVLFIGGTSLLNNLDNFLSHRLAIPVEHVTFLDRMSIADDADLSEIEGKEPVFVTAMGLALRSFRT
ncbi:type IV pilus assembly protein PilM [Candidatus Poribacteria bacterium]|nr:type IV pilus assembly protein PilM [Candidatus Poribacteria bacterium]